MAEGINSNIGNSSTDSLNSSNAVNTSTTSPSSIDQSNNDLLNNKTNKIIRQTLVVEKPIVGSIDHLAISKSLGYQIFRKTRRNAWTIEEDKLLKNLLIEQYIKINNLEKYNNEHINIKEIDWFDIASKMKTKRKGKECKKRWVSSLDPYLRKGKWTKIEDDALINAFKKHGASWQKVASEIEGRNEDQCSKRYTEVLNSDTKERLKPWSLNEDLILIEQVKKFGTKWRQISNSLPSRPSLTCRNRWRKIMNDIAKDTASDIIKKAIGVLDENGVPIVKFKQSSSNKIKNSNSNVIPDNNTQITTLINNNESNIRNENVNRDNENNLDKLDNNSRRKRNSDITDDNQTSKRQNINNNNNNINNNNNEQSNESFTSTNTYSRIENPVRTQTDWSFSLVDPRNNEEVKSFSSTINTQELAHYLIELAKFNGISLTVHQHIHHHYSSSGTGESTNPQTNISRYGHFNYLPPLIEVPKLNSSSSPDNTVDSTSSNKNHNENPLVRLLNNDNSSNNNNKNNIISNSSNMNRRKNHSISENNKEEFNDNNNIPKKFHRSHRQQFGSNQSPYNGQNQSLEYNNENHNSNNVESPANSTSSKISRNKSHKYKTNGLDDEFDFWETMRSISHPKSNKPVSQHHPLHYYQPSNYKEQLPYQPSDSFGIQRFPNMATPLIANMMNTDGKNSHSIQTNVTNVTTDEGFNGIYMGGGNSDGDDDEEDEIDIANQYGLYYSVFANRNQGNYGNYGKSQNGNNINNGPVDLVNSGYLMPFNPS